MSEQRLPVRRLSELPRYTNQSRPPSLVPLDDLFTEQCAPSVHRYLEPDAWLVEASDGGHLHRPLYDLGTLEHPRADGQGRKWHEFHITWKMTALDIKELVNRAKYRAGVDENRTLSGCLIRAAGRPYKTSHPLALSVRITPCCGRVSEIAFRSLFELVNEHYRIRSEPGPSCTGSGHVQDGSEQDDLEFADVLPELERLGEKVAQHAELITWGALPALAVYAEIQLARGRIRHQDVYWLFRSNWIDLQATDVLWRNGDAESSDLTCMEGGEDAAADTTIIVDRLHQIANSHSDRRSVEEEGAFPVPARTALGAAQAPQYLLPVELGAPGQQVDSVPSAAMIVPTVFVEGLTDTTRTAPGRREQPILRRALMQGREAAPCALCGQTFPASYLRAAHIKRRAEASEDERRDLSVAMLACTHGCDQMFELGDIYVEAGGLIRGRELNGSGAATVVEAIRKVTGRCCSAYSPRTEPYFRHHRHAHGYHLESQ